MPFVQRRIAAVLNHDVAPGIALVGAAVLALIVVNSTLSGAYSAFLATPVAIQIGVFGIDKPLQLWINDGLMAIFFFFVGLEIKREVLEGRLSNPRRAALPAAAALGGVALPAAIFAALNWNDPAAMQGWAIPAATDIAFALGILALLGTRAPAALKVFLLAVAIIDDLMAIIIIAAFYTSGVAFEALAVAFSGVAVLFAMNRLRIMSLGPYVIVGLIVWAAVLKSGVHATLAGVVIAMTIPIRNPDDPEHSPLSDAEHWLKPWVLFAVMPLFAFANAGVPLAGIGLDALLAPLPLGIVLGLFIGKQLGVFGAAWLAIRSGIARMPSGMNWMHLYGASLLAGVGFTMSLFIGALAFAEPAAQNAVRLGVMTGSLLSAVAGLAVLWSASERSAASPARPLPAE